ncbi:PTS sugar transporter subunit IIB [Caviibacter abscessus]|uniref:PTS sugar transporter subunit IIB n=1 Tax=Caviibacter abscessus TaxID=1766719 RepID=UPI000830EF00|nr:PTS sugar transporter subunit IIB [Caviibacter abscessus]
MKIKLFCASGMSTSLLVNKMREAAKLNGIDAEISAYSADVFINEVEDCDVILLGPQITYMLNDLKKIADEKGKAIDVVPIIDYGMMNGANVLNHAIKIYSK